MAEIDELGVVLAARDRLDAVEREQVWSRLQQGLFGHRPAESQLGRFMILERLGSGGQGRVYLAFDPKLVRRVAIKLVRPEADRDPAAQQQLLHEAQALAQLAHPHVVAVHDVGTLGSEEQDAVFLVMEYVEGPTLAQWLAAAPRSVDEVFDRFVECGRGLAHAHAHGIVHRDFKPSNAIVALDGRCRVVDFGLARAPISRQAGHADVGSSSTAGTPAYMSPEQHDGRPVDARTDQFAFCVALWAALTNERPFVGANPTELAIVKRRGPPPLGDRGGTRGAVLEVCRRGMLYEPAERFAGMDELLAALTRARTRRRRRWTAIAIASATLVAFGGWRAFDSHRRSACAATGAPAGELWAGARPRVEQALLGTQAVFAADTWTWVDGRFAELVAEWSAERTQTCVAAQISGSIDASTAARRIGCLEAELRQMEALLGVLEQADLRVVTVAIGMTGALPSAQTCRDDAATVLFAGEDASEVGKVLELVDRATWLRRSGRLDESAELGTTALEAADALASPRLQSRARVERGKILLARGKPDAAEQEAKSAWMAAEHAGSDELAIAAITTLADAIAAGRGDLQESLDLTEVALARLAGAGIGPRERFALERTRSFVAVRAGQYALATEHAEAAVVAARSLAPHHPDVAAALVDLGNVHLKAHRYEAGLDAFVEAERIIVDAFSPSHPDLLATRNGKAGCLRGLGRLPEALAVTSATLELAERIHGEQHPLVELLVGNRGMLLAKMDDADGALRDLGDALARRQARLGPDNRELLGPLIEIVQVHIDRRDFARAAEALDRATGIVDNHPNVPDPLSPQAFMLRGEVAAALGHDEVACASFTRALALAAELPDVATEASVARATTGLAKCGAQ